MVLGYYPKRVKEVLQTMPPASRQAFGLRCATASGQWPTSRRGNVVHNNLFTTEVVKTGEEASQVVRDRATDWLELEENMANMTVDDRHNGKILTKLLAHPAIRAKHQIVSKNVTG